MAIARDLGNLASEAICLGNMGNIYADTNEPEKAVDYYEQALDIDRDLGNRMGQSVWLGNIGVVYTVCAKYDGALKCFEEALAIDSVIGNRAGVAELNGNIGETLLGREQNGTEAIEGFEKAKAHLVKGISLKAEIGNPRVFTLEVSLARCQEALGHLGEAIRISRDALELASEQNITSEHVSQKLQDQLNHVHRIAELAQREPDP